MRYNCEPKVVLDRLLLNVTYSWEVDDKNDNPNLHRNPRHGTRKLLEGIVL